MHQESFKTNEQTKTKITTTTKQPWKTLFCSLKCHPVSSRHPATGKLFPLATHEKFPRNTHDAHTFSPVPLRCYRQWRPVSGFTECGSPCHCHSWGFFERECFLLTTEWKLLNIHECRLLYVVQNDSVTLKTCTVESKKSFLRSSSRLEKHGLPGRSEITLLSGKKDPNVGPWRHWRYIWGRYTSMKVFI